MLKLLLMFLFGGFCGCFFTCLLLVNKVKVWQQKVYDLEERLKNEMLENLKLSVKSQSQKRRDK